MLSRLEIKTQNELYLPLANDILMNIAEGFCDKFNNEILNLTRENIPYNKTIDQLFEEGVVISAEEEAPMETDLKSIAIIKNRNLLCKAYASDSYYYDEFSNHKLVILQNKTANKSMIDYFLKKRQIESFYTKFDEYEDTRLMCNGELPVIDIEPDDFEFYLDECLHEDQLGLNLDKFIPHYIQK